MSKLLKVLGIIVLLVIVAVAVVFFWLDPNVFKPQIQSAAKAQGVNLNIKGDMRWQFWPSIGVEINDIQVASIHTPEETLATLKQASLLVATGPLLSGKVEVHHLTVDGAFVNVVTNAQGVSNWAPLMPKTQGKTSEQKTVQPQKPEGLVENTPETETTDLTLLINAISISNAQVSIVDEAVQQKTLFSLDNLQINNVNTAGQPIDLEAEWAVGQENAKAQALNLSGKASAQVTVDSALSALVAKVALSMTISGEKEQESFSGELSLRVKNLTTQPTFTGQWSMAPVNIKKLLASVGQAAPITKNPEALTKVAMDITFNGSENAMTLSPLALQLDQTALTGSINMTDIKKGATVIALKGDQINIDDYLPPAAAEKAKTETVKADAQKPPVKAEATPIIPLEVIKALDITAALGWQEIIAANLTLTDLTLKITAKNGVVNLHDTGLNAYDGKVALTGKLQAKANTAAINFNADMQGVELAPLLKDLSLDEDAQLSGAINLNATGGTQGITTPALMDALVAQATFDGAKVKFSPLNVEERFCQLVTLLNDDKEITETEEGTQANSAEPQGEKIWPKFTAMRELNGVAKLKNQIITLESFNAGVAHLGLTTLGTIDLKKSQYELYLPFKLFEKSTSETGCTVKSNYWLNRSLSLLKCHGSLESLSPLSDCGFDEKALGSLTADYATYKVKKELSKKFAGDNKNGEKSIESQAVEALFDIFTQKNKGKNEQ